MLPSENTGFVSGVEVLGMGGGQDGSGWDSRTCKYTFDASAVVSVGGDNRPKNVYVTYIIKY